MDLEITDSALKELFLDIDNSLNGKVTYSELINYINNKQKDYERITRLNQIKKQNSELNENQKKITDQIAQIDNSQKFEFKI